MSGSYPSMLSASYSILIVPYCNEDGPLRQKHNNF